jgi:Skp family chaperone for outer membrane proteins
MKRRNFSCIIILLVLISGIALSLSGSSPAVAQKEVSVGVIDIEKVMEGWPKFKRYSEQIQAQRIAYSVLFEKASPNLTDAEKTEMQYQITKIFEHSNDILMEVLTNDMGKAAQKVAVKKGMDLVLVKQRVHGIGIDITDDVLKELK